MLKRVIISTMLTFIALLGVAQPTATTSSETTWNFSDQDYRTTFKNKTNGDGSLYFNGEFKSQSESITLGDGSTFSRCLQTSNNATLQLKVSGSGTLYVVATRRNSGSTATITVSNETSGASSQISIYGSESSTVTNGQDTWKETHVDATDGDVITLTGSQRVFFYALRWVPDPTGPAVKLTPTGTTLELDADLTATFTEAASNVSVTVNGSSEGVTLTQVSPTVYTISFAKAYETAYEVTVTGYTATGDIMTITRNYVTPGETPWLEIADYRVPNFPASGEIPVYVPYYSQVNYQDEASVLASIKGTYTATAITKTDRVFNSQYSITLDGREYTFRMYRQAFRVTNATLNGETAYAFYLMPTQPMVDGNESYAMTIVANVSSEGELSQTPTFDGTFTWYDGSTRSDITPQNLTVSTPVYDEAEQHDGCRFSRGEITFTYNGMDVKAKYILSLMPGPGEYRAVWFDEIPAEMYIPNIGDGGDRNGLVFRGLTIYPSDSNPQTPVRVTNFNLDDPTENFQIDGYSFNKSLKMGGRVTESAGNRTHRYLRVNDVQGQDKGEGNGAEIITMLVSNGSNDWWSTFEMAASTGDTSAPRDLPRGTSAWWSFRAPANTQWVDMYGYDRGNNVDVNGDAVSNKGGNVQYTFLEIAPGMEVSDDVHYTVEADMTTVEVGVATRALASSVEDHFTVTVKYDKNTSGLQHYRQSKLHLREIGTISDDADMVASNQDVRANAKGAGIAETDFIVMDLVDESQSEDANGICTATVVLRAQQKLKGNTTYELWTSDATFILKNQTIGGLQTWPVSYAAPVYIIHTVNDEEFVYDFETSTADSRIYPNNVYPLNQASAAVVAGGALSGVTLGNDNGDRILEVKAAEGSNATSVTVGFNTPVDPAYPGEQEEPVSVTDKDGVVTITKQVNGYKAIQFDVYVPASVARAPLSVTLRDESDNIISLTNPTESTHVVYNPHIDATVPTASAMVDSYPLEGDMWKYRITAYSIIAGAWFAPFQPGNHIYVTIDGTDRAYIDNVEFIYTNQNAFPTDVKDVTKAQKVYYNGREVVNPTDNRVEVYNLSGVRVLEQTGNVSLDRLARGIYIVRCGDTVLKISK